MPVEGPTRWQLTITHGISDVDARPMSSLMSEIPGPELDVIAFTPANEAPITIPRALISSSA